MTLLTADGGRIRGAIVRQGLRSVRRGFAALTVVMVLFFIMALVAAYFNRGILVEQRVGAAAYRGMRAAEAADAGVDWALSLLNAGRLDSNCRPSTSAGDDELRQKLFVIADDGGYSLRPGGMRIGCVIDAAGSHCVCPTAAAPSSLGQAGWPSHGGTVGFRVNFRPIATGGGASTVVGLLPMIVNGCGFGGQGAGACTVASPVGQAAVDGATRIFQFIGLLRNLPLLPPAALTLGGTLQSATNTVVVVNTDSQQPITVHSGQAITGTGPFQFQGPAGSVGDGRAEADAALASLVPSPADAWTSNDRFFRAMFQLEAPAYRAQPAVIKLDCASGCTAAVLMSVLHAFPQRTVWIDGDLTLDGAASTSIGSDADPVLLVIKGRLTVDASVIVKGMVYAENVTWGSGGANAAIDGALVAMRDMNTASRARVLRNANLLTIIHTRYGSWVRMPNGWSNQ